VVEICHKDFHGTCDRSTDMGELHCSVENRKRYEVR